MIYNLYHLQFDRDTMLLTIQMYPSEGEERKLHTHVISFANVKHFHPHDRPDPALRKLFEAVFNTPIMPVACKDCALCDLFYGWHKANEHKQASV